jgi:hypothetical protein
VDPDSRSRDEEDEDNEFMGEYDVSFEFRFETAKLLLELDENTDEAIDVLEELLDERDGVIDVWHLLALANHGCCNFDRALELLGHAEQLNEAAGGDEGVTADLMELRSAVEVGCCKLVFSVDHSLKAPAPARRPRRRPPPAAPCPCRRPRLSPPAPAALAAPAGPSETLVSKHAFERDSYRYVEDSKSKWKEDVGADHQMGGTDDSD